MRTSLAVIGVAIVLGTFVAAGLWKPAAPGIAASKEARQTSPEQSPATPEPGTSPAPRQLFPPEDLPLLEGPDRELWQKPELVMDTLRIAEGSKVADMTSTRRSSRAFQASFTSARPMSVWRLRSWNSSRITVAVPRSSGSWSR